MLRSSRLVVLLSLGMVACSKPKDNPPISRNQSKEVPATRTIEKAAKPSPYKSKAPRQVTTATRVPDPRLTSAQGDDGRPQSE
jgi:hypothetical protein